MKLLYLILLFFTVLFPLVLSFDKKVAYSRNWKWVLLSAFVVSIPFLLWDQFFTLHGVWGFNDQYLLGVYLGHLPLEEVLFFFVVPFACTFIYECVKFYFKKVKLKWFNYGFAMVLLFYAFFIEVNGFGKWYTDSAVATSIIVLALIYSDIENYRFVPLAFTFAFVPFLLVNGILTGFMLADPVVWYSYTQFSQLRMGTIPLEDALYGFSLITLNIVTYEYLKSLVRRRLKRKAA
ncbi:MAG: lycopene cyclase domain-containing protein [Crocinitomicaceae bacterium]|nr:lycopene cyclase domain-containing protein [Crocinitomicaceae bacterium]